MAAAEGICCANCSCTQNLMKRCTGCLQVFYCSRECQRNHWSSHKRECLKVRILQPTANNLVPVENQGSGKMDTDNEKKHLVQLDNLASTKGDVPIGIEGTDIQCRNNTPKPDSHNGEKTTAHQGTSHATNQLSKLSSPISVVGDLKQRKCLLGAHGHEVIDTRGNNCFRFYKDNTESKRSASSSEGGNTNAEIANSSSVTIFIKHNKTKHALDIPAPCVSSGKSVLKHISDLLHIPIPKLKLIHKGKMVTPDNIVCFISGKALFQAFGEVAETEDGLEKNDIDLLMKQAGVERNTAIRALRNTGTVIDAIIDLGNK